MTIAIRLANWQDQVPLGSLLEKLYLLHHQAHPELVKPIKEIDITENLKSYLDALNGVILVAVDLSNADNKIVGLICGHFAEIGSFISTNRIIGNIDELWVDPDYRGFILESKQASIAQSLLKEMEGHLFKFGAKEIRTEVWAFNQLGEKFYRSNGFESHIHCLRKVGAEDDWN